MDDQSKLTAYHEAAHMVVGWELGLNVLGATIVPDPDAGYAGRVEVPIEERVRCAAWVDEREYLYAHAVMAFAGQEASDQYVGQPEPEIDLDLGVLGPDSDYHQIGDALIELAGPDEQEQIEETSERARRYARLLVESRWELIGAVAETLMERETLDERACREVLEALL